MSLDFWSSIIADVQELTEKSDSGDWQQILDDVDHIEKKIHLFFEQQVQTLSQGEQAKVKSEGAWLMQALSKIMSNAKAEKQKNSKEVSKLVQGKKGISAYKKS